MIKQELYYTIESILNELTEIIVHNSYLPKKIIECYEQLQEMSLDIDDVIANSAVEIDHLGPEIYDIYLDMVDLYVEYLEEQSKELKLC